MEHTQPKYYLDKQGQFVIENYNLAKPFANFFPGIAGRYGIPMWVFYVNRGQAIASFGIKDKDHCLLEFRPANKAWQTAPALGFRTFIKVTGKTSIFYEPFQNSLLNSRFKLSNSMRISSYDLTLEEKNQTLGINVKVEYFNIPNEPYAALARKITITNSRGGLKKLQLLDGLPQVIPFGTANFFLKKMSRTIEAWMNVKNMENNVPFFKLDVDPGDRPELIHIHGGNFYLGFNGEKNSGIIRPIINPETVFGEVTDFSYPYNFLRGPSFSAPKKEIIASKTPCAFLPVNLTLGPNTEKSVYVIAGFMKSQEALNSLIEKISSTDYFHRKKEENKNVISGLQSDIETNSSSKNFDFYAKQTYLDNLMRGGYPIAFDSGERKTIYYLFSRKHGDLERDYNKFQLQAAYFSQGNGNYRDANQNRRCDIWFNPAISDENLVYFLNLLQTDGFNPLVVKGASFLLKENVDLSSLLNNFADQKEIAQIKDFLRKPFNPGEIILFLQQKKINLKKPQDEFLNLLINECDKHQEAEHAEGFWTDHWTYNLDLMDSYLSLYPEKFKEIIFEKKEFIYYDNIEVVKPRSEKYVLHEGKVRQLRCVTADEEKRKIIQNRTAQAHAVRTDYGKGEIYKTTLINKLFCLLANKLSSLDPFGVGIEMEANKPNWFDSLNGLPALFGSSTCETFELKRLILLLKDAMQKSANQKVSLTQEIYDLLKNLDNIIKDYFNDGSADKDFQCWDKSYSLKENFRDATKFGLSGKELDIEAAELSSFLENALKKVNLGLDKGKNKDNTYSGYYINEVKEYEVTGKHFVKPKSFTQKRLPLFLESQMHALRLAESNDEAKALYKATRLSDLFDRELKMYKVTAPLSDMPLEIGRCRVFSPGWLENESIWLHMEYKYLLETLKHALYEEFYEDLKNALIPFQNARRYGRNILENSSFLVSSAFPDKKLHGNGFVARLSGSTAEFLQIWLVMNIGQKPFFLNEKSELNLSFKPALAGWLFDKQGNYSFNFLSKIKVNYHDPKRKDTFGKKGALIKKIVFKDKDSNLVEIQSDTIPSPYAEQIRSLQITRIDIEIG